MNNKRYTSIAWILTVLCLLGTATLSAQPRLTVVEVDVETGADIPGAQALTTANPLDFGTLCLPPSGDLVRRISVRNVGNQTVSVRPETNDLTALLLPTGRWKIRDSVGVGYNPFTFITQINALLNGIQPGQRRDFRILYSKSTPGTETPTITLHTENPNIGDYVFGLKASSVNPKPNITTDSWDISTKRGSLKLSAPWYFPFAIAATFKLLNEPETPGDLSCLAAATITRIEITQNTPDGEFAVAPSPSPNPTTPFVLAANGSQVITVHFTPNTTATTHTRTGKLKVTYQYNSTTEEIFVDLIATINEAQIHFRQSATTVASISFGKVRLGTLSPTQNVNIVNVGTLQADLGDRSKRTDSVVHRLPFIVPSGGQIPRGTQLAVLSGETRFTAQFAPQATHFGPQTGTYLVETLQGTGQKRTPYDTLYATGIGAVPHFRTSLDTVFVGQAAISGTANKVEKNFWLNTPDGRVPLANLIRADIKSVEISSLQPATAASEFAFTRTSAFSLDEDQQFDETFTFTPTTGETTTHLALVKVVFDSIGTDNREQFFVLKGTALVPEVTNLEQIIDFGEVVVGNNVTPVTPSILSNLGLADLVLTAPVLTDPNVPTVFTLGMGSFPMTVPKNKMVVPLFLNFRPTAEQEYTGTFTVKSNAYGKDTLLTFTLKGKGILPGIQSATTALDFGNVRVGRTVRDTIRVRNTDPNTPLEVQGFTLSNVVEFTVGANKTLPLSVGNGYEALAVAFTPNKPVGPRLDSVLIDNTSQRRPAVLLQANVVLGAMEAFTNSSSATAIAEIDFGAIAVQQQATTTAVLRNTGTFQYYLTRLEIVGTNANQFSLSASTPGILLVGGYPADFSIDIQKELAQAVSFFPTSEGVKTALLRVIGLDPISGLPEDTTTVLLRGDAIGLGIAADDGSNALDFGEVLVGTTAVQDGTNDRFVRFTNTSKSDISITSVALQGVLQNVELFRLTRTALSLAPNTSDTVRLYFSPTEVTPVPVTAAIVVAYDNGLTKSFPLLGRGVAPSARIDGVVYTTNSTRKTLSMIADVGSSSTAIITLSNTGDYPLQINNLRWENNVAPWLAVDALPGFLPLTLQKGETKDFQFTFTPTTLGIQTGTLLFTSNHVAMDKSTDSTEFGVEINTEGIYSEPPILLTALLPALTAKPGDIITVPIAVQSPSITNIGVQKLSLVLSFDATLFAPHSVATGTAANGFTATWSEPALGSAAIELDGNGRELDTEGTIVELTGEVLLGKATSTQLVLDPTQAVITSRLPAVLTPQNGSITLSEFCAADRRIIGVGGAVGLVVANTDATSVELIASTPSDDPATIVLYDSYGRAVATPLQALRATGTYSIAVDTRSFASGVYFAVLRVGTVVRTAPFTVWK